MIYDAAAFRSSRRREGAVLDLASLAPVVCNAATSRSSRRCEGADRRAGRFGFVEMRTEELASSAMAMDKVDLCGRAINVGRPKGYVEPPQVCVSTSTARPFRARPFVLVWATWLARHRRHRGKQLQLVRMARRIRRASSRVSQPAWQGC